MKAYKFAFAVVVMWKTQLAVVAVSMASAAPSASGADVKLEYKECLGASTIVGGTQVCNVLNIRQRERTLQVETCVGLDVSASGVVVGGRARVVVCATVSFPVNTNPDEAKRKAEEIVKQKLTDPEVQKVLREKMGQPPSGSVSGIGELKLRDEPKFKQEWERLVKEKRIVPAK